jgi:hypothetical protein
MKTLKTMALIGASALAVSAVSTAAVQAQPYGYGHQYEAQSYGYGHQDRADFRLSTANIDRLNERIVAAARFGRISWGQARELRQELDAVRPLAWRAQTGRANGWEIRRLTTTVERVESVTTRYASNDRDRYRHDRDHDGYDSDHDGYDRDSGWRR